jgi:hypothetical protein
MAVEQADVSLGRTTTTGWFAEVFGAGAVEVDEDVAGFSAFAGADDAAVFEFVHDAGGAGVAEAEAALEEGDAGLAIRCG